MSFPDSEEVLAAETERMLLQLRPGDRVAFVSLGLTGVVRNVDYWGGFLIWWEECSTPSLRVPFLCSYRQTEGITLA